MSGLRFRHTPKLFMVSQGADFRSMTWRTVPHAHCRMGDILDLGGRRVRFIDTPNVPHGWDAGVIYEEDTSTLFCGDLFVQGGDGPALTTTDILAPAIATDATIDYMNLVRTRRRSFTSLSKLAPKTLAVMHGSSFQGDGGAALTGLAHHYAARLQAAY